MNREGVAYGLAAYGIWGLSPVFWKWLAAVPAEELLAHRVIWSFVLLLGVMLYRRRWAWLALFKRSRRTQATFLATSLFLFINWYVFLWAINAGYIVESSLGYFINPLVNVVLGVIFLNERLRPAQWVAVGLATTAVIYLTVGLGALPWISLTLAFSFGFYGYLRKTARLDALEGLALEVTIVSAPLAVYLLYLAGQGAGHFGSEARTTLLMVAGGLVTAVPLFCFSAAARRLTLTTLGILQYLAPTIQFILGVFVYDEPFTRTRLIAFSLIWLALLIFTGDSLRRRRRRAALNPVKVT